ncbi:hypothetical protein C8R43DRAFT_1141163 [Mycena crocata]|nr:hypothetical protein C8R43DRAFT_1141163 [Mycena crocata]
MSHYVHNWGRPGIDIPTPGWLDGYGPTPLSLTTVSNWLQPGYSTCGVTSVSSANRAFEEYLGRFLASDIAWFVDGASTDNKHHPSVPGFFPEFKTLRDMVPAGTTGSDERRALNARIQNLTFDLVCGMPFIQSLTNLLGHGLGSPLWRYHNDPAYRRHYRAEHLPLPQYLRTSVYLPPSFVDANPASHGAIAQIAQLFIEAIGVPTVQQWRTNAHLRGWRLTQPGPTPTPNAATSILVPQPLAAGSAHYKFRGRPVGALDQLLKSTPAPAPAPVTPAPVIVIPDDDDDEVDPDLLDVMERAGYAEFEARHYRQRVRELQGERDELMACIASLEDLNDTLQDSVRRLRVQAQPTTPTRNSIYATTSTPARGTSTPARLTSTPYSRPPPYSPSGRASSSRLQSPTPRSPASRSPAPPVARAARVHVDMETFISENRLDRNAIVGMVRYLHPARWYNELTEELQLTDELATELNEILALRMPPEIITSNVL